MATTRITDEVLTIDLKGHIAERASIEFMRAELSAKYDLPLALIRYSLHGQEQEKGLRLDLDKQVFLDHFEEKDREETAKRAAPQIVEFLGSHLRSREQK